jgi:chromosome segregation ATPase
MTTPLSLRLRLSLALGLYGSALLAPASFALSPSEVDSLTIKASRGNAIAQYTLGLALADPREPAYEPAQAYVWLSLASLNGTTSKALSTLTQQLSPADLAEGKRRLESAIADPVSPAISPITPGADSHATSPVISRAPATAADPDKLGIELAAAHKEKELVKAELTAQLADTRKRIAIAEAALESKDREIALLGARLSDLNRTLAGGVNPPSSPVTAAPAPTSAEVTSLRNERDQLLLSASAATHELAELRAKFSKSTAELNAQREKLERLSTDVAAARRAQALAEAEGGNLKAAAQLAAAERRTAAAQLKTATAELAAAKEAAANPVPPAAPAPLAATVKALEAELAALTTRLTEANRLASTAQTELAAKHAEITALQARVDAASVASGSLTALQSERDRLAETLKSRDQAQTQLTAQLTQATAEAAGLRSEIAQLQSAATASAIELTALRSQVSTATQAATTSATASQSAAAQTASELEALRAQLTAAQRTLAEQRTALDQSAELASKRTFEAVTLRAQLDIATQAAANAAKAPASPAVPPATAAELETLRTQLASAQTTIEEQRTGLTQAVENLAGARKTISLITADLVAVQDLLREARTPSTPTQSPLPAQVSAAELESAARLAELEKAKTTSDTQLAAALRSFTLQQTEITRLQTALASINDECIATGAKLAAATTELNVLRPQAASASAATTETEILRAQLTSARRVAADQSTAATAAAVSLADARKTVDAATAELVTTRDQLRQTQATAEATAIELQQAKTRLALVGSLPAGTTPSRPAPFPTITLNLPPARPAVPVAQPPAVKPEAPAVAATRYHTVGTGDTLTRIAKQYYGNAGRWNDILEANRDVIRNPDNLAPGTKLRLP